ncbi:hypothetical protein [Parasedimentitalea psychrophila]|uniref:Uncharacterized protein n=1 Tax=Parasedimentitalea psychrophila TaxID=2997337 RepID=A0A9Y2P384_9RHOB|nr:hypothetical protein [Parasedimentitalea psychrophila]WIY24014.1 hypothetical protein QPJ95_15480 [Parasedimentitalea psychrophila]
MTDSFAQRVPAARVFLKEPTRNSGVADLMPRLMLHGFPKYSGAWPAPAPPLPCINLQQAAPQSCRQYHIEIAQLIADWAGEQDITS